MSPHQGPRAGPVDRFPRVSGDEPRAQPAPEPAPEFSPRERG